jgi:inner membrane protein
VSTWVAHAALGAIGANAARAPRKLVIAAAACACVPDLDVFTDARGLLHGLPFAVVFGAVVALLFRTRLAFMVLIAATASHGLLDAMTYGGRGVELLAPFRDARVLFPLRPLPSLTPDLFSFWTLAIVGIELAVVVLPAWLIVRKPVVLVPWLLVAALLTPRREVQPATELELVPGGVETRVSQLRWYFDHDLTPKVAPWSSSFFPYWFGGEAGRWKDPVPLLVWRTLAGTEPGDGPNPSPTEKVDLADGDKAFTATRASLALTHNRRPRPRFWFGLCNGVAAASLFHPEPAHDVRINGVTFEPNDVKALLGAAYYQVEDGNIVGDVCTEIALDNARRCSMSPATLVLATLSSLGRYHRSFLIDVHPSPQAQYFAVAAARVHVLDETPKELTVELTMDLASTLLSAAQSNGRVGVVPERYRWRAVLTVENDRITGGRWIDDGPDFIVFVEDGPKLHGDSIDVNPALKWSFIKDLAEKSAAP